MWSFDVAPRDRVRVRVQNSIGMPEIDSVTLPDVAWVQQGSYRQTRPSGVEVLLLVEVADSSLARDRGDKGALYAEAGIQDYWIVNLRDQVIEVHRQPRGDVFGEKFTVGKVGTVSPLALPEASLNVAELWQEA
jgi:Uma2 family endonuclease